MMTLRRTVALLAALFISVAVTMIPTGVARADDGLTPTVTFTPGTGPLERSFLSDAQYNLLPPAMRTFVDAHHVGDRWAATIKFERSPAVGFDPTITGGSCPDPNNCDYVALTLNVYLGVLEYQTVGVGGVRSTRPVAPAWIDQFEQARHHDNNGDFPTQVGSMTSYCDQTNCAYTTNWGDVSQPVYLFWLTSCAPDDLICQVLLPPAFPNASVIVDQITASQQIQVTDSFGNDHEICLFATYSVPDFSFTWGTCPFTGSGGSQP